MRTDDPEIRNRILPALERIGRSLLRCVVPILRHENGVTKHEGCGFLVSHGAQQYLVSAAHVLRRINEGVLCISLGGRRLRGIDGRHLITPRPGVPISQDDVDVAVVLLEGANLPPYPALEKYPVPSATLMPAPPRGTGQFTYFMAGYPGGQSDRRGKTKGVREYRPYSYTNEEAPAERYKKVGADAAKHILTTFNQKRGIGPDGLIWKFPYPFGMSGSPLWLFSAALPIVPIVGVLTRWPQQDRRCVVATDIRFPMMMIQRMTGEIAPESISQTFTGPRILCP